MLSTGSPDLLPPSSKTNSRRQTFGMCENVYLLMMHLSQFLTLIITLVVWLVAKKNETLNEHIKNILNFSISFTIYLLLALMTSLFRIGIPFLTLLIVFIPVFIVIAAVKALKGEYWEYPFSVKFFE